MNRGWQDQSAYTVTFKLQEAAAGVSLHCDGVDPAQAARYIRRIQIRMIAIVQNLSRTTYKSMASGRCPAP